MHLQQYEMDIRDKQQQDQIKINKQSYQQQLYSQILEERDRKQRERQLSMSDPSVTSPHPPIY